MNQELPIVASQASTRSRYPGTRPFTDSREDQARFFGRAKEGEQLYLRVLSVSFLMQFAASGLGKTSLLQASLFPRLRTKPFLPVMVRLNVAEESLVGAVARSFNEACKAEELELPELQKDGLWELLSTALAWRGDLLLTPVLVFDQFEEVFTLRDRAFRDKLAEELGAIATGVPPERLRQDDQRAPQRSRARPEVKIVISLREDYLGALEEFSPSIPNLFHERLRVEPLAKEAAREAITRPALLVAKDGEEPYWAPPFEFDDQSLVTLIAYLEGESGVIEPFTLQLLCREAEAIAHKKEEAAGGLVRLTLADFKEGKDFEQVLKNFYQDALKRLEQRVGKFARSNAEELCEHALLDRDGRRLLLEAGQVRDQSGVDDETLDILLQERLVRRERRLESTFYEISHDRLAELIYASRRNKLPKKEQEQRQKELEQLEKEQNLRKKQLELIGTLKRYIIGVSALAGALAIVFGLATWFYIDAESSRRMVKTEKEEVERQRNIAQSRAEEATRQEDAAKAAAFEARKQQVIASEQTVEADEGRSKAENAGEYAKSQQRAAETARHRDEELLSFTLGEKFLGEIQDSGRTSTLEKVRAQTEGEADPGGYGTPLIRGLALRNGGDVERTRGNLPKSLEYFGKALQAIEESPASADQEREVARTLDRLAGASKDSGRVTDATSNYANEVETWSRVLVNSSADPMNLQEDCASMIAAKANLAAMKNRLGDPAQARTELDGALKIVFSLLFGTQSTHSECGLQAYKPALKPNPTALMAFSEILAVRSEIPAFDQDREASATVATEAERLMLPSISARRKVYEALAVRGKRRIGLDALADYRQALNQIDQLRRLDPEDKLWEGDRAEIQLLLAEETVNCHSGRNACRCPNEKSCEPTPSLKDAEAMILEAMGALRVLSQSDPSNLSWKSDLGDGFRAYARVLAALGWNPERVKNLKASEKIYRELERDDDAMSIAHAAGFFEEEAEALTELRQGDQAKLAMEGAIGRWSALIAAHKDNSFFKSGLADALGRKSTMLSAMGDKAGASATIQMKKSIQENVNGQPQDEKQGRTEEITKLMEDGDRLLDDKNYEKALEKFNAAELATTRSMIDLPISSADFATLADVYAKMAELHEKRDEPKERLVALSQSTRAAEIASAIDPENNLAMFKLIDARLDVMLLQQKSGVADDGANIRQLVAGADSLARRDRQFLGTLGMSKVALGKFMRGRNEAGWEETCRSGLIDLDVAVEINKRDGDAPKLAGEMRETLADQLEKDGRRDEGLEERRHALKDYQEALKRDPLNSETNQKIRELKNSIIQ